jgi:DMSO/TMAO reductase YedYZ molybdopterin-dependent catalytic subunit
VVGGLDWCVGVSLAYPDWVSDARSRLKSRRQFVRTAASGASFVALGGVYRFADEAQAGEPREDGRPRLPPGQRLLTKLKPMGGRPGEPGKSRWRLKVHGEVAAPFEIDFRELLGMPQVEQALDVHCVTGWSVLGARWRGVRVADLAGRAKPKAGARHVVFEAAHGYTANVRIAEALAPSVMVAHRLDGSSLALPHGSPVRGVVPDLYFWKSAKWLTGIRFVRRDEPGYWERRGYHNHADPWLEERHSDIGAAFG